MPKDSTLIFLLCAENYPKIKNFELYGHDEVLGTSYFPYKSYSSEGLISKTGLFSLADFFFSMVILLNFHAYILISWFENQLLNFALDDKYLLFWSQTITEYLLFFAALQCNSIKEFHNSLEWSITKVYLFRNKLTVR